MTASIQFLADSVTLSVLKARALGIDPLKPLEDKVDTHGLTPVVLC
jgi:hypothetical protein